MIIACEKIPIFDRIGNHFLGDIVAVEDRELLKRNGVKIIICLVKEKYKRFEEFTYHDFAIDDNRDVDISCIFGKTNKILSENENVFIHCQNAVSRSVSIILAYLMYSGNDLKTSFHVLKNRKTYTQPNIGFCKQLLLYEKQLFGKNSISLKEIRF
jgi:dual specificity phosphatase 12